MRVRQVSALSTWRTVTTRVGHLFSAPAQVLPEPVRPVVGGDGHASDQSTTVETSAIDKFIVVVWTEQLTIVGKRR